MRRPGTLPASNHRNNISNTNSINNKKNNICNSNSNNGIFMSSQSNEIPDISTSVHQVNTLSRNHHHHHSSQSLRRNNNSNQQSITCGGNSREASIRMQNNDGGGSDGIYEQILGQRHHSPPCPQSSYPTLPINDHISHHYHHYREHERIRDRTIPNNIRDRELPIVPHRNNDKHIRDARNPLELEIHGDGTGIGIYQA